MNKAKIKSYAPAARRAFIKAVTERANRFGLFEDRIDPVEGRGDVVVIAGQAYPSKVAQQRMTLERRIKGSHFDRVMEEIAYTWFNRFVALRYMEIHGYLDHGYRVLGHPGGGTRPEILDHAEDVVLTGLNREKVIDLKLDGNKDEELYRMLLVAQCNELNKAMDFLFAWIDDETALLLPDNLLHSDSLVRKMVEAIDEEDWLEIEIIGWIYQFYISERKDQVIGKVVKSEDIPAATQLFTPNWIVKYMVENTLGRKWLATYPDSPLREKMEFYIEPAEQTPEVQEQLRAITPESLNPEEITFLDPACGSGHILVEAYNLFKAIYEERGYQARDIPKLILEKNLFGLEIDDRASQLAAFALLMRARANDRASMDSRLSPQVFSIQESKGLDKARIGEILFGGQDEGVQKAARALLDLFEDGKTFGSLIRIPSEVSERIPELQALVEKGEESESPEKGQLARGVLPFLKQGEALGRRYDCVVANPPYMGGKGMIKVLKEFAKDEYPESKADLFTMFMVRGLELARANQFLGMVTMQSWMFLSSMEKLRESLIDGSTIESMAHLGSRAFTEISGEIVQVTAFALRNASLLDYYGSYKRLVSLSEQEKSRSLGDSGACLYTAKQSDFRKIPGQPIAYWISDRMRQCFEEGTPLGEIAEPRQGMATADNDRFLRRWFEVNHSRAGFGFENREEAKGSRLKWFPYNKGGEYRRWYGNSEWIVNWENDGSEIEAFRPRAVIRNPGFYFRPSLTWTDISSSLFGVRCSDPGFIFDRAGSCVFPPPSVREAIAGMLSSKVASAMLSLLNPTMHFQVGNIASLPICRELLSKQFHRTRDIVTEAVEVSRIDWDAFETSWDFKTLPVLEACSFDGKTLRLLESSQEAADQIVLNRFDQMRELETENNRLFIEAYGLQDELSPEVPDDQITLYRPDRETDICRLISYAIGCMMGRYSLDKPGLIYAQSGSVGFDPGDYAKFSADDDGIIPLTEESWFDDDATHRFVEFIATAWPRETLDENLKFVADSLTPRKGEAHKDTIRRYLSKSFFKDHLQTYKNRPIYWLFSSGKLKAFECLVYLHRYSEGTLSRMRMEYVVPLQSRLSARIDHLRDEAEAASSTPGKRKLEKERERLVKQLAELIKFDEKLRHHADQRITLDLDDGVKVNYGKFGDLLAEVKKVTGEKAT